MTRRAAHPTRLTPDLHRRLEDYARKATAWVLATMQRLAQPQDLDPAVVTVLSGESEVGDGIPAGAEGEAADSARYLTLLRCLPGRPAIYAIGLACLAERAALEYSEPTFGECLQQLRTKTRVVQTNRFPKSMRTYFQSWSEVARGNPTPDALLRLARDVAY